MNANPEKEREHFDKLALEKGIVWWGHETKAGKVRLARRAKLAVKEARIGENSKILEIGCGNGDFTRYLALETKASILAVDISPELIKIAREKIKSSNVVFEVANVEKLPFESESFDIIAGKSILHHLNLEKTLPELKRVLKKEGRIFFSEPNMLNPQVFVERNIRFIGKLLQNSPTETAFFRWRLSSFLARQGFSEMKIKPFDFLHPAVPAPFIGIVSFFGIILENLPLVKEFAGSLIISAKK